MKVDKYAIKGFVASVLAKHFDNATKVPSFHEEWWDLCCSDHKRVAIAAPRGHAKSTAITISYGLATLLFRERQYMLIVSDTETQAGMFLQQIKSLIFDDPEEEIKKLFGVFELEKETQTDIIVTFADGHKFRIMAKGSGQPMRGTLWIKRPDIIICDDLENDEIVLNKDRRDKFRRWFYGTLVPIGSKDAIFRIVGTILHLDSFLNRIMPDENKKKSTHVTDLKIWSDKPIGKWVSVKYRAHNETLSKILWPDRWSKEELLAERADYIEQGLPDVYSQEYLNNPIDESRAYYKKHEFQPIDEEIFEAIVSGRLELAYHIGVDLAISKNEGTDYTVFVVAGVDATGKMYILNVIRERMDTLEIVDMIFELERIYKPEWFCIEKGKLEKAVAPFLSEQSLKRGLFPYMLTFPANEDKSLRGRSMQGRMRAGAVWFDRDADWFDDFHSECLAFPRGKWDDQFDAFANVGLGLASLGEGRTQQQVEDDEYEEEVDRTGNRDEGRNTTTGY